MKFPICTMIGLLGVIKRPKKRILSAVLFFMIPVLHSSPLPEKTVLYEAEDYFMKDGRFHIAECIHTSGTRFVSVKQKHAGSQEECFLFQADFPSNSSEYTIWACVRNLNLELRSPLLNAKKINGSGGEWHWISLGRYQQGQIGSTFSIYGASSNGTFPARSGIDTVLLSPDRNFVPRGVFQGYSGKEENGKENGESNKNAPQIVSAQIDTTLRGKNISKFIASANAHGIARHMPENEEWDQVMRRFYSDNLLAPLISAKKNPKPGEDAWNFKEIDQFIQRAKEVWKVKEIMLFPQWFLKFDAEQGPTQKELDFGSEILMQLVHRYGKKDSPLYVRYWVLSDEWPCGGYWKKNYVKFAGYYASLTRKVKAFNPELIVGGPVDCWPNDTITAELLRQSPELDFIAWNMFITGRGDTPLKDFFKRTSFIRTALRSSQELGRRWHGKELPVMITSLGPNYHAWDPLDKRLAEPIIGVWHALALNYMAEENCAGGLFYNIRAQDCGFFGTGDPLAKVTKMQPPDISGQTVNLRPAGRVVEFYKTHFAGKSLLPVTYASSAPKEFSLLAASDEKGETVLCAVNFSETPRLLNLQMTPFQMEAYDSKHLPSRFLYCDQGVVTTGEGFFFRADGKAELWMPPYSAWNIVVTNRDNFSSRKESAVRAKRYQNQAAVFHLDNNMNDDAASGSKSLGWYGEHFSSTIFKCGTGSGNYTGDLHARAIIQLKNKAVLNGKKEFGIAFWIYRVKNTADYGSVLSFGTGKFMLEHVGGGNPDARFQVKNAGFCNFGGTWNHSLLIPKEKWTHVAITADGKFGRIIVDGKTKWKFPQTQNGLNGSDRLYLGSQQGDLGPIDCYVDEVILSANPVGEAWAKEIYDRTKDGQNY